MAGENGILQSGQSVSARIAEFAAKLRSIHEELSGRIDSVAGDGAWIGPTAPTDTARYGSWVKVTANDVDLLYNLGTTTTPNWVSVLRSTVASETKGVPFKTSERIGERVVWAVDVSLGYLPNASTKMVSLPTSVTSVWGTTAERWLDPTNCSAHDAGSGTVIALPYTTLVDGDPDVPTWDRGSVYLEGDYVIYLGIAYQAKWYTQNDDPSKKSGQYDVWTVLGPVESADIPRKLNQTDLIDVYLKNNSVYVKTVSNKTGFQGSVRVKYLKAQ